MKAWVIGQAMLQECILDSTDSSAGVNNDSSIAETLKLMRAEIKSSKQNLTDQLGRSLDFAHESIRELQNAMADMQKQQQLATARQQSWRQSEY